MKKYTVIFAAGAIALSLVVLTGVMAQSPDWKEASVLYSACERGALDEIGVAVDKLGDANGESMGETALHICVRARRSDSLEYLLELGADVNVRDYRLQTLLHCAVRNSAKVAAGEYVEYEREPNLQGMAMIEFLLRKGADVEAVDNEGQTAADLAEALDYSEVVQLFEDK